MEEQIKQSKQSKQIKAELSNKYSLDYYKKQTQASLAEIAETVAISADLDRLETALDYNAVMRLTLLTIRKILQKDKIKKVYDFIDYTSLLLGHSYADLIAIETAILGDMECTEASRHFEDYMNAPQEDFNE